MVVPVTFSPLSSSHQWRWLEERAKPVLCSDVRGVVAYQGIDIVAVCAMDSWTETSFQIHIAIDNPIVIRHGFLHEICTYGFVTADRKIMIGLTPGDNAKALKFNRHCGLKEVYRLKDGYADGVDYVVQEMRREGCRWLNSVRRAA